MQKKELIKYFKILLIILLCVFSIYLFAVSLKNNNLDAFQKKANNYAKQLDSYFTNNQILGTTRTLGLTDASLKDVVRGKTEPDNAVILNVLGHIKSQYSAAIVYVLNNEGKVVGCTPYDDNKTLTGNSYTFRPYFLYAMQGRETVYPALGVTTKKRGLYYASPIYDGNRKEIIGVLVVKLGLNFVDTYIDSLNIPMAILSPNHIVFASNQKEWMLRPLFPQKKQAINQIQESQQFSDRILDISVGEIIPTGEFKVRDASYNIIHAQLSLMDSEGTWDLLFFIETKQLLSFYTYSVGAGAIMLFCLVLLHLIHVQGEKEEVSENLKRQNQKLTESEKNLKRVNSELLKNEEKLKSLNTSLDIRVKERTAELQKEKMSLELKVQERTKDLEEERKSLENKVRVRTQQLEEAKESLELKVKERTEELAQNIKRLEETNQSMMGREKRILDLKEKLKEYEEDSENFDN